jgi:hypothetical protein
MLHVQTANGRDFAIDLSDVVAMDFDNGVLAFHTDAQVFRLGGNAWGGPVAQEDAQALIMEWEAHKAGARLKVA